MSKKIFNQAISCFIAVTIFFGLGVTVSATGENPYVTIDLTQYQNAVVFGTEGTAISDADFTADKYPSNQPVDINSKAQYALNKTVFEGVKTSGFIYSADNIPYDVNTNGAVMLGCNNIASKEIVVPENYYDNITFLICNGFTMSQQVTALVTYADNSTSSYVYPTVSARSWSLNNISGNQSYRYINGNTDIKQDGTRLAWNEYYPTYSIPIANKYLKVSKIKISTTQRYNGLIILGVTGKLQTDSEIAQHLVEHLPDASSITSTNYYSYISSIEGIQNYIDNGAQLSAESAGKYEAVSSAVNEYVLKYKTIDLSSYQNAKVFAPQGTAITDFTCANYTGNGTSSSYALNKQSFDAAKTNGLFYSADGRAYNVNTNGGVMLGCNGIFSVNINIPEDYFDSISLFVDSTGQLDSAVSATVTYSDNTTSAYTILKVQQMDYLNNRFTGNESYCYIAGNTKVDAAGNGSTYKMYLPTYSIPVAKKTQKVSKITVSTTKSWAGVTILGVTGNATSELDIANNNIGTYNKEQVLASYELLRSKVAQGKAAWNNYSAIVDARAEYGIVTINNAGVVNGKLTANVNIASLTLNQSFKLIVAVYDADGKMSGVNSITEIQNAVISNSGINIEKDISLSGGQYARCFAIDGFTNICPLSEAIRIE